MPRRPAKAGKKKLKCYPETQCDVNELELRLLAKDKTQSNNLPTISDNMNTCKPNVGTIDAHCQTSVCACMEWDRNESFEIPFDGCRMETPVPSILYTKDDNQNSRLPNQNKKSKSQKCKLKPSRSTGSRGRLTQRATYSKKIQPKDDETRYRMAHKPETGISPTHKRAASFRSRSYSSTSKSTTSTYHNRNRTGSNLGRSRYHRQSCSRSCSTCSQISSRGPYSYEYSRKRSNHSTNKPRKLSSHAVPSRNRSSNAQEKSRRERSVPPSKSYILYWVKYFAKNKSDCEECFKRKRGRPRGTSTLSVHTKNDKKSRSRRDSKEKEAKKMKREMKEIKGEEQNNDQRSQGTNCIVQ